MKKLFSLLSSLKLAVILLVLLLIGLSAGTIVESRAGTEAAGTLVYYSGWFLGLEGLLAVNLACSLASYLPWTRGRAGYVLTHGSLLLILAGALVSFCFKVEGMLPIPEGGTVSTLQPGKDGGTPHALPFSVHLDRFTVETYPGTMRPSGFESQVQITDLDTGSTFPARIWMNHELHHRGYALFQSSYQQTDGGTISVLSVSKDPGQIIVFAGYLLLIAGMITVLATRMRQGVPAALVLLALAGAGLRAEPLARLPVQHDGRVMPLDTLARETVWSITGSYTWKGQDPTVTLLGWSLNPNQAFAAPVVALGSADFARELGLPGETNASFMQLVQSPRAMQLVQEARMYEAQGAPVRGLHQAAQKLDKRLETMQTILQQQLILARPVPGDPKARWNPMLPLTRQGLEGMLMGARPEGWPSETQIDREILYNRLDPVRLSWIILVVSLAVSVLAWVRQDRFLERLSAGLLLGGFAMMTWGLLLRWQAGGRFPAANMYESLLFLAWGAGLFALAAYVALRNRLVVVNAASMAALTLLLTDFLPIDRFIHPVAPVLSGTPWLAIHVPIIMLGYAALALGMAVAHMQVAATAFGRKELADRMYELLYWYLFVGSIFLIAGIITGSMWAASSWGRYWGWDPKEVWSLVAFLAYMAILHAKVDRLLGRFGVAVVSVIAFQSILMTYLGVNFVLTTGMHSYAMGDSPVALWMILALLAEAAFLAWGIAMHRRRATS